MEKCGINTQAQKELVLKNAKEHFNDNVVKQLDDILKPQYLGWETPNYEQQTTDKNIVVYNHRPHTYKNYPWFLEQMDKLWEKRQDFKVWIPLLDLAQMKEMGDMSWKDRLVKNGGYIDDTKFDDKESYHNYLSQCKVGYSPPQKYNGWSVATTDGMMTGCPFIMFDADYYHELNPTADFFGSYEEAIDLLEKYLDDNDYRNKKAEDALKECRKSLLWSDNVKRLSVDIDKAVNSVEPAKTYNDGYKKLIARIKDNQEEFVVCTKKKLIRQMWGNGIKFAPYLSLIHI